MSLLESLRSLLGSNVAYTENDAISNRTTGNALLDQFFKAPAYRDREQSEVDADMQQLWETESPQRIISFVFYLRMITRNPKGFDIGKSIDDVQRGQGIRDESFKRLRWIVIHHPTLFYRNMWLIPLVGCWKDLWHSTLLDVVDTEKVYSLCDLGLKDSYMNDLVRKYLPRIRSRSNTKNDRHGDLNRWGKGFCEHRRITPREYRKLKSTGKAHEWQQVITKGDAYLRENLNFSAIPGKALFLMTQLVNPTKGTTFIDRHGLEERYTKWLLKQKTVKFTGYIYELYSHVKSRSTSYQIVTLDKQFDELVRVGSSKRRTKRNILCAIDTSGSMQYNIFRSIRAIDVCVSLGIYFSAMNWGYFKDHVVMFDRKSRLLKLEGTFSDRAKKVKGERVAMGNTNFQSVIDVLVHVRKTVPTIPIEEYPDTILVVSDMQFDPSSNNNTETNYQVAMKKLNEVGLSNVRVIWWNVVSRCQDVPSTIEDKGTILLSGFDPSILNLLLDAEEEKTPKHKTSPEEAMNKALEQPLLQLVSCE